MADSLRQRRLERFEFDLRPEEEMNESALVYDRNGGLRVGEARITPRAFSLTTQRLLERTYARGATTARGGRVWGGGGEGGGGGGGGSSVGGGGIERPRGDVGGLGGACAALGSSSSGAWAAGGTRPPLPPPWAMHRVADVAHWRPHSPPSPSPPAGGGGGGAGGDVHGSAAPPAQGPPVPSPARGSAAPVGGLAVGVPPVPWPVGRAVAVMAAANAAAAQRATALRLSTPRPNTSPPWPHARGAAGGPPPQHARGGGDAAATTTSSSTVAVERTHVGASTDATAVLNVLAQPVGDAISSGGDGDAISSGGSGADCGHSGSVDGAGVAAAAVGAVDEDRSWSLDASQRYGYAAVSDPIVSPPRRRAGATSTSAHLDPRAGAGAAIAAAAPRSPQAGEPGWVPRVLRRAAVPQEQASDEAGDAAAAAQRAELLAAISAMTAAVRALHVPRVAGGSDYSGSDSEEDGGGARASGHGRDDE